MQRKRAVVIGAGFGGLAMGIRLQALASTPSSSRNWTDPGDARM